MYGGRGGRGWGLAKQGKILLNLALCPANLYLEVGKYVSGIYSGTSEERTIWDQATLFTIQRLFAFRGFPFLSCYCSQLHV